MEPLNISARDIKAIKAIGFIAVNTLLSTILIVDFRFTSNPKFNVQSFQALAQTIDPRKIEADRLFQQGIQHYQSQQFHEALAFWNKALAIYLAIGDKTSEANILNNAGKIYTNLGEYPKAINFYQESLVIARRIGDKALEANILNNLGGVYRNLAEYSKAIEFYQQSLKIARLLENRSQEAVLLNNLGKVYESQGKGREYQWNRKPG